MAIKLTRDALLTPLQKVMGIIGNKRTISILSHVLLKKDKRLTLTGTDLEVELSAKHQLENNQTGENQNHTITLPGRKLLSICRSLPAKALIELYPDKGKIVLRSGRSRFTLLTLPTEDFPTIGVQNIQLSCTIPQNTLKQLIQRTYFSMAQQDVRFYLNGLLLEVYPDHLCTVATDGHRFALNRTVIDIPVDRRIQVIVPRKGVVELLHLLANNENPITLILGNNFIKIIAKEFSFISKLIEGRFPSYEQVIPRNGDKVIVLAKELLKQSLTRASVLSHQQHRGITFELRTHLLRILAYNLEQEVAEEEIDIYYNQDNMNIAFNVNYLSEVLNTLDGHDVKLTLGKVDDSLLIEESKDNWESVFVIMPMRI